MDRMKNINITIINIYKTLNNLIMKGLNVLGEALR